MKGNLKIRLLKEKFCVCRLNRDEDIPKWIKDDEFYSVTRTSEELSIVCVQNDIPDDIQCEKDWRILKIQGPLDFSLIGVLASISNILSENDISIFAISTYDTDYILVKNSDISNAVNSLSNSGYEILFN
ncbi:ACT domain-containing protein [Clostridium sp. LBM24168]